MNDKLVKALHQKLRLERKLYKNLVMAHARALEENEQLKDTIAVLMEGKGRP